MTTTGVTPCKLQTIAATLLTAWTAFAGAQPTGNPPHHQPPPEALAACKSLQAGQACNFTSPRGAEQGTCFAPEGKPLACRPKNPPGGTGGPPNGGPGAPASVPKR